MKAARKTPLTQRKEPSHLPCTPLLQLEDDAGPNPLPQPPLRSPPPPGYPSPRQFWLDVFQNLWERRCQLSLGKPSGSGRARWLSGHPQAVCPPPWRGPGRGEGKAWRWGQLRGGSPASHCSASPSAEPRETWCGWWASRVL